MADPVSQKVPIIIGRVISKGKQRPAGGGFDIAPGQIDQRTDNPSFPDGRYPGQAGEPAAANQPQSRPV